MLHVGNADSLIAITVNEDTAGVWTELRPELAANVLRDIANDLNLIAVRATVPQPWECRAER